MTEKNFKLKLKWCIKNEEQIKMDILASHHNNKDFKQFWKGTSDMKTKSTVPSSVNGVKDPRKIADIFQDQFQVSAIPLPPETDLIREVVDAEFKNKGDGLIRFGAKEISRAIQSMKRGKSPGHDGLSIEHFQCAGIHLPRALSMLYSFCINHVYLPQELMKTIVVPIVKNKTGDISDKNNYRPISLATTAAKVLDSLLNGQLSKNITLNDAQFGFQPNVSTESAILALKHTVEYYTKRKTSVYACFLDLSKAFDRVSYRLLWEKLEGKLPIELVNIFKFWYHNQINHVRWSNSLSNTYRLECGVRQGGLSSPLLFNLYMDQLLERLSSMHVGCSVDGVMINNISYADDMVLLSPSISGLRKLMRVCEEYAANHGLIYNTNKSELLIFTANNNPPEHVPPVTLYGKPLKMVQKFKYLGHIVTEDLKDDADIERERRALAVRGNMIVRRFARCSVEVKLTLFRAYCQCFYTSNLWIHYTQRSISALRVQYNNILRMLLGLPRFCSASGMFADARIDGFNAIKRKRIFSLLNRIRGSPNRILSTIADKYDSPIIQYWIKTII